jgi:hypothetical protein
MTGSQTPAPDAVDPLERAHARLDEACARVAARLDELAVRSHGPGDGGAAAAPDALGARELELAEAAQAASQALEEAMTELRRLAAGEAP